MKLLLTVLVCITAEILLTAAVSASVYDFDSTISCETLEAYLSRALVLSGVCCDAEGVPSEYEGDNLRAIANVKPKFIGRAALAGSCPADDELHFATAREIARKIHRIDPEIILQSAILEAVFSCQCPEAIEAGRTTGVEKIPVPARVFEAFGLKSEDRCFDYEAMLFPDGSYRNNWAPGGSVPDITRTETQMWYYYRATRYIDAGYEAIHFGQADLVGRRDDGRKAWTGLLDMVREYARKNARRHYVLCDAHFFARNARVGERYLWDFFAFPIRPVSGVKPFEAALAKGHGDAGYDTMPPGIHPAGWECDILPQLYEIDNFFDGIDGRPVYNVWGADEISWFANCPEEYRNSFLVYAADWLKHNVRRGYMSMPGIRPATFPLGSTGWTGQQYRFNTPSPACPAGFGQEETVKALFARPFEWKPMTGKKPAGKKEELLGFVRGKATVEETFGAAVYTDNTIYTDDALRLIYRAYGAFSPEDIREQALKEIQEKGLGRKPDLLSDKGLVFTGERNLDIKVDMGPEFSLFIKLSLKNTAFDGDLTVIAKSFYNESGFHVKYSRQTGEFFAELADGSGKAPRVVFPYPRDEKEHVIAIRADGKTFSGWLDGRKVSSVPAGDMAANDLSLAIGAGLRDCVVSDIKLFDRPLSDPACKRTCLRMLDAGG
ncbi:MAG: hypothetical protein IJT95_01915 [Abditibacteriota bacterium]|nr:hypothetical protein [Abditibacteriota bacterium]